MSTPIAIPDHPSNASWLRLAGLLLTLLILAGCASKPKPTAVPRAERSDIVNLALSFQGTPYRWGEETPEAGFDCSGFVQYVYGRYGYRLPRTAYQQAMALPEVDPNDMRPGDLIYFNTTGTPYSHVGMYIGHNDFVHASSAKGAVVIGSLTRPYWQQHMLGVRRPDRRYPESLSRN